MGLIAVVFLTPKPRGVAKFRECQLPWGGDSTTEKEKRSEAKTEANPRML